MSHKTVDLLVWKSHSFKQAKGINSEIEREDLQDLDTGKSEQSNNYSSFAKKRNNA